MENNPFSTINLVYHALYFIRDSQWINHWKSFNKIYRYNKFTYAAFTLFVFPSASITRLYIVSPIVSTFPI